MSWVRIPQGPPLLFRVPLYNKVSVMERMRTSPYASLLDDDNVHRWYENLGKGSNITADAYRRRLGYFCNRYSLQPKDLATMGPREIEEKLQDFLSSLEQNGRAGSYIQGYKKAVK